MIFIKRETLIYDVQPPARPSELQDTPAELLSNKASTNSVHEERAVYLAQLYYSEIGLTNRVQHLVNNRASRLSKLKNVSEKEIARFASGNRQASLRLAPQQLLAIKTAVTNKVTILTGGPGTGKTTTLRALLDLLDGARFTYALASPTGRAAKRLAEATGREAKTVHRLLEYNPGEGFGRNDQNPLDADMIVVDEASMLDLALANNLFKAIQPDRHVLLVGDIDQLPSVGAGDVLGDLIASGVTAVVRLQTIFRQASGSLIIL